MSLASQVPTSVFMKGPRRTRLWCLFILTLNLGLLILILQHGQKAAGPPAGQVIAEVDQAAALIDVQGDPAMAFQQAEWLLDYEQARAASQKSGKPIFMFTMKGRIDGRC